MIGRILEEKTTDQPEWRKPYRRYFFLGRWQGFWRGALQLGLVSVAFYFTLKFLADPTWRPNYDEWMRAISHMHGRRAGTGRLMAWIALLFLLLPFWLRTPIVLAAIIEAYVYAIARLVFTFDNRPDFSIGPQGIVGLHGLRFYSLKWSEILDLHDIRSPIQIRFFWSTHTVGHVRQLSFNTAIKIPPNKLLFWRKPTQLKIVLYERNGFDLAAILVDVKKYAPIRKVFDKHPDRVFIDIDHKQKQSAQMDKLSASKPSAKKRKRTNSKQD